MRVLNPNQLIEELLIKWIERNSKIIWENWLQKGGWEGWAQVEIMRNLIKNDVSVQREIHIYQAKKKKVDFVVNFQDSKENQICLELKCESLFQSTNDGRVSGYHNIQKKIKDDIDKISQKFRNNDYKEAVAIVALIFFSPEAYKSISDLGLIIYEIKINANNDNIYLGYSIIKNNKSKRKRKRSGSQTPDKRQRK